MKNIDFENNRVIYCADDCGDPVVIFLSAEFLKKLSDIESKINEAAQALNICGDDKLSFSSKIDNYMSSKDSLYGHVEIIYRSGNTHVFFSEFGFDGEHPLLSFEKVSDIKEYQVSDDFACKIILLEEYPSQADRDYNFKKLLEIIPSSHKEEINRRVNEEYNKRFSDDDDVLDE